MDRSLIRAGSSSRQLRPRSSAVAEPVRTLLLLAGMLSGLWPSVVLAEGVILNGVSPRSIGRGGTNLAHNDNGGLIFDNPAGILNLPGNGLFDVGFDVLITEMEYSDPENTFRRDAGAVPLPQISVVRKTSDGRWAFGLGIFTPAGFNAEYELERPIPLRGEHRYESFGALVKVLPAAAWRVTDRLTVGGTLGLGVSHAQLEGPYFLQSPGPLQGLPTLIDVRGTGVALVYSLGMQYELTEQTTFGMAYQSESRFNLNGRADVEVPVVGAARYDTDIRITWPRSFGIGLRHDTQRRHVFSTDLIWYDWSSAFDDFGITFSDPSVPIFPTINERFPLDWRDSVSVRLGYEFDLPDAGTVRLGYVYHRNPIPASTLTPWIQAIMEHGLSFGYGFKFHDYEIDVSYSFVFGNEQRVGQSGWIGGDFDSSRHRAQTHALNASVIKRF